MSPKKRYTKRQREALEHTAAEIATIMTEHWTAEHERTGRRLLAELEVSLKAEGGGLGDEDLLAMGLSLVACAGRFLAAVNPDETMGRNAILREACGLLVIATLGEKERAEKQAAALTDDGDDAATKH